MNDTSFSPYSIRVAWRSKNEVFVASCPELGDLPAEGETAAQAVFSDRDPCRVRSGTPYCDTSYCDTQ